MEIRDLIAIARLSEFGSVTRAARDLGVNTSTLSRRLSALEDELGILLFERQPGGMRTTPAGIKVIRLARRALGDVEAIRLAARRSSLALAGEIRLATQSATLGPHLRAALMAWLEIHKGVNLEVLEVDDGEALAGLRERRIDAAVIHAQDLADLMQLMLWIEQFLLAVPDGHPLACRAEIRWPDVRTERVLIKGARGSDTLCSLQLGLLGPGVDTRIHHVGSLDLLNLVAMGEGVALTCGNHREIAFPGVRYVAIDEPNARIPVALAWRTELEDPVVGSFVAFMRDWVKTRPMVASAAPA